jgi:hypothetical protein
MPSLRQRRTHRRIKFRVIDGCPVPASVAPYVYLVLRRAGHTASSIYRGEDARKLLHAHGKQTQAEIHQALPHISNPPGLSQHELRSDGVGTPNVPRGGHLHEWQVGVDSGTNDVTAQALTEAAARGLGWKIRHPYRKGAEGHHWQFATRPKPKGLRQRARIIRLRATLPRR